MKFCTQQQILNWMNVTSSTERISCLLERIHLNIFSVLDFQSKTVTFPSASQFNQFSIREHCDKFSSPTHQ